jgi:outer membrane lipoprotein-sorting protein
VEGLLDREESLQCQAHLETCVACRAEHAAITRLQRQLAARGQATAEVSIIGSVMRRVHAIQTERERNSIMTKLFTRWGFGLSAAAGAAAIVLIVFLVFPKAQATAAEVMTKGAQAVAKLTSIHLRGQLRTYPAANFDSIDPDVGFCSIELWKQFEPDLKWRVEKPERVIVMDGASTAMFVKSFNSAWKGPAMTGPAATNWLQEIANISNTITNDLNNATAKGWNMSLTTKTGTNGRRKDIVTIEAKSNVPANDYVKNTLIETCDSRRVYIFDDSSELLESAQIYLHTASGDKLIFTLDQIDYNQPIDTNEWTLTLPADVSWYQPQKPMLTNNAYYAFMTAEQAARAFFEACSRNDWDEAGKFVWESPINRFTKERYGGLEIISIGTAFTSTAFDGQFVPYVINLKNRGVSKWNLTLQKDKATGRWFLGGGY